jgi:hypothetical protein
MKTGRKTAVVCPKSDCFGQQWTGIINNEAFARLASGKARYRIVLDADF